MKNHKFVTVGSIATIMARNHKNLSFEKGDLIEWCWECLEDIGAVDDFTKVRDKVLPIVNGLVLLPCGIYRFLSARYGNVPMGDYYSDGVYLHVGQRTGNVSIDYDGIPTDDEGYPRIPVTSRQACYRYCLKKLLYDDYLRGEIPENRWQEMDREYEGARSSAKSTFRNKSRDDLDNYNRVLFTFVPKPAMPRGMDHGTNY